ncbi:MAG: helix-turn-helix transcriptional regulator, partial [Eggerthellaceae bacterium]
MARGVVAVLMFAIVVAASHHVSTVYRVGLLAMIAGFMMMPFLFGTELFWISGAVIIGGYTTFDLLIWVAFSQIAHAQSRDPLKTIAVMRLLSVLCTVVGFAVGIALVGTNEHVGEFVSAETTVVGYLVVIAAVLTLSSEDMWMLSGRPSALAAEGSADDGAGQNERLEAWFDAIGLTVREREIGALLANGRTQPWIAERLSISENTVGTHVRHIYQKADVHGRQEFIDQAFSPSSSTSPESRDPEGDLTGVA